MTSDADVVQGLPSHRIGFWGQLGEVSSSIRWADIVVYALILGFGALQFFCALPTKDFLEDHVFYVDAAHSIIDHGYYGVNGYPETNMPPGVSAIIALFCIIRACTPVVCLRAMVVFGTLSFLASYELLRCQVARAVAAAICLVLIASPIHFLLVTQWLSSCYPYFFTTICALLVARKLEKVTSHTSRIGWGALLSVLISASLMFNSSGIAFLGAIVASVGVMFFGDRDLAFTQLRTWLAVLVVGIVVQGLWMHQPREASAGISAQEWPVPGFPHSYLSQLKVKDGRYPELGTATLRDIPIRILKNAYEQANFLSRILLLRWIYIAWMSTATIGILLIIAAGWCYSVWLSRGGLQEWYFAGYEFIYFLWPWPLEGRFFLPIAPLACLYVWRGGQALVLFAKNKPRVLGLVWLPMAILLSINAWFWMHGIGVTRRLPHAGWQDEASLAVWLLSAILALWMVWAGPGWPTQTSALFAWYPRLIGALRMSPLRSLQILSLLVVVAVIGEGLKMQLRIGRENLDLNSAINRLPPDAEAGVWIRVHTDKNAIVMARQVPTIFHYSKRDVVWFPPSSNPQMLMEGIIRHKVNFVVVVRREKDYYLPPDHECFDPLLTAYPDAFHLVQQAPEFRIYQVTPRAASPGQG